MDANRESRPHYSAPWEIFFPSWSTGIDPTNSSVLPLYNVDSTQSFFPVGSEAIPQSTPFGGILPASGSSSHDHSDFTGNNAAPPKPSTVKPPQPAITPSQATPDESTMTDPSQGLAYLAPPGFPAHSEPRPNFDMIPGLVPLGFILLPHSGNGHFPANFTPMLAQPLGGGSSRSRQPQSDPAAPSYFRHRHTCCLSQKQKPNSGGILNKGGWTQPKWKVKEGPIVPGDKPGCPRLEGGQSKLKYCKLCLNNGEPLYICYGHTLHDSKGNVTCPDLRSHICKLCGATGDNAHTIKFCPLRGGKREAPVCSEENSQKK